MPNYYGQYPMYQPGAFQAPTMPPQAMQIQDGGFVSVRNETEARNYPVGLGKSVTFKDETAPYIYTKTMGFSKLDVPKFDKYKLVKEASSEQSGLPQEETFDDKAILNTIDGIKSDIKTIWSEIDSLKKKSIAKPRKKEVDGDDPE